MELEIKTWLFDILNAIEEIESFTKLQDFGSFHSDLKTKRAVERDIEIIGEAMGRVPAKDDSVDLTNTRKIVDTRNRIIHGYDTVSDEILWNIIMQHLSILKREIKELLK